ncbi:MAG: cupin domain-containing protein [Pseudomonadota bacterium]
MPSPILNLDDVELIDLAERARQRGSEMPTARFGGRIGPIAPRIGARKLGYNLTEIAPGKAAFPKHSHRANEEMFFVLEGRGELRLGDATHPIRAGDVIACPPGGPETAHQLINTGTTVLKFLAVSTMEFPEICEYPDSNKLNAITGMGPDDFRHLARHGEGLDYWDGEA